MMQSYDSDLVSCGGGKIEPIVTIMNMGTEDMTSCSIQTIILVMLLIPIIGQVHFLLMVLIKLLYQKYLPVLQMSLLL